MASNLRELAESKLSITLEGRWALPVILVTPDGDIISESLNDDLGLRGQIKYDTVVTNPETGEETVVNEPVVSLRISSLSRVPKAGEKWAVRIPTTPSVSATKEDFLIGTDRPPEGGSSIGFIRLYLRRAVQS